VSPATAHRSWHRRAKATPEELGSGMWLRWIAPAVRTAALACSGSTLRSGSARRVSGPVGDRGSSPARPGTRTRRSGRFSTVTGSRDSSAGHETPPAGMSGRARATCCTWILPATHGSSGLGIASLAIARNAAATGWPTAPVSATTTRTRSSTTTHASHTSSCTTTRKPATVTAFVTRALAWFQAHGIEAKRLMTDNAWNYTPNSSLRELLFDHHVKHLRTQAYRPQTNGKVERFSRDHVPRMGLRHDLPLKPPPRPGTATLARALQQHQTPFRNREPATHQPRSQPP
jgi:transposase InsO family protein